MSLRIQELMTLPEMALAYPVLVQMYPDLTQEQYEALLPERLRMGYRVLGVFKDKQCVGTGGFWLGIRFYCGKFVQLDSMVIDQDHRNSGAGKLIIDWIKDLAKKEGCSRVLLDTYVENFDAHRFFHREDFVIRGYHMNYFL